MAANESAAKIYTKGGDKGKTSLIGGSRVSKSHIRLDAYGTIDELNSVLGLLICDITTDLGAGHASEAQALIAQLSRIQSELFDAGSQLACEDAKLRAQLPGIDDAAVLNLENAMDEFSSKLKPLKHFVLPGGARSSSVAHIARTICRRAERFCVHLSEIGQEAGNIEIDNVIIRYVNRLSDYLFVLARHLNRALSIEEPIWMGKSAKEKSSKGAE
jgi:cob(I)alamin adenosyltransferase